MYAAMLLYCIFYNTYHTMLDTAAFSEDSVACWIGDYVSNWPPPSDCRVTSSGFVKQNGVN